MRTRQGETFDWGKGFFALPRLISRPQEGSVEECGRDSDWGFSPPNFVPVKLAHRQSKTQFFKKNGPSIFDSMCKKLRQSK
ncbi:MAG: hypothetical protein A3D57_02560 [Candidatus Sungbacteria bacterium RIFCSPHIGHO2_02_FULL_46_12]|nr:MAG: hypothetical protein A3D57_02560 [Candidatus Sungbacteria bacterium RIFCSPHIGHO2_02_FULL_46_12]